MVWTLFSMNKTESTYKDGGPNFSKNWNSKGTEVNSQEGAEP